LFSKKQNNSTLKNYSETNILVVLLDIKKNEYIAKISLLEEGKQLIITSSDIFLPTGNYLVIATSDDVIYGRKITAEGNYSNSAYIQNTK
jgi:DNA/RNA endonuclease G (NUC1)